MISKKTTNPIIFDTTFKINKDVIQIYVEKIKTECKFLQHFEFIFTVNGSTHRSITDFSLVQLYQILKNIQQSIETLIVDIVSKLDSNTTIKLEFEADGKDESEKNYKTNCYQYYINRLANKYCKIHDVNCCYYKYGYNHFLTFTRR
jgi:hypothetical protein